LTELAKPPVAHLLNLLRHGLNISNKVPLKNGNGNASRREHGDARGHG
jgi:hypothetical protein